MNALGNNLMALGARAADIVAAEGGDLVRLEAGEMADGSGRPFALVTTFSAGLEQVYRIAAPAPPSSPPWALRAWTTELRQGDRFVRLEEEGTLCTVHEAGACPPGCEFAYGYEAPAAEEEPGARAREFADRTDPPAEARAFDVLERQEDGSWEVVGKASGRSDWDALRAFGRDVGIDGVALGRLPGGRAVLDHDGASLSARPAEPRMADLLEAAQRDTTEKLFELLRLFGIEGVAAGAIADADRLPFVEIADAAESIVNAASAASLLAEPPVPAP
jgi:hypothetical protein